MGNRANVVFTDQSNAEISPAIYLHWNGGPESVYAFLAELITRDVRHDAEYAAARFTQIVGEFFGSSGDGAQYSLGISNGPAGINLGALEKYDTGDNGVYVVQWNSERDGFTMRRFVTEWDGDKPTFLEQDAAWVAAERATAEGDATFVTMPEFFKAFREAAHGVQEASVSA